MLLFVLLILQRRRQLEQKKIEEEEEEIRQFAQAKKVMLKIKFIILSHDVVTCNEKK